MDKWYQNYACPDEEKLEEFSRMSLGLQSINHYREKTSKKIGCELKKYSIFRNKKLEQQIEISFIQSVWKTWVGIVCVLKAVDFLNMCKVTY